MTLRRQSWSKSPRRTSQTLNRRALVQSLKQLSKVPQTATSPSGNVLFGAASKANLKVVVRVRPLNAREQENNAKTVIELVDEHMLVFDPKKEEDIFFYHGVKQRRDVTKRQHKDQKFVFERVFGPESTNQDIFETTTKDLIDTLLEGYNCSVFAYGATGAGKTFTMVGRQDCPGITLLTLMELYARIDAMEAENPGSSVEVAVSYLEVYNETVRDLLQPGKPLQVQEAGQQVLVPGLSYHKPRDADHLMELLAEGNRNRTQHPTDANAESSRSHAVFQVVLKKNDGSGSGSTSNVSVAKLSMIDLAGSERGSSTGCKGARFREGANINRSLLALGNCINALADGKSHIPYRDSKLTRLLKDSLGGNCRSVMVAAVSMASTTFEDTFNTLRYSNRAKTIKTTLKKNQMSVETHVHQYVKIVETLKQEVTALKEKLAEGEHRELRQAKKYEETIARLQAQLQKVQKKSTSDDAAPETIQETASPALDVPAADTSPPSSPCPASSPVNCEEREALQEQLHTVSSQVCALHREWLQVSGFERELQLRLYLSRIKTSRLDILASSANKLNKSLTRLQRQEKTLSDRLAQTVFCRTTAAKKFSSAQQQWQELRQRCEQHAQLHCSSPELQHILDNAPLQEALRVQEQEGSSLRVLLKESLGEVKEGHRLQCLLLHAVCGLHERLNSNHSHTDLTNNLFQSVVSDLDEYRIAWADQRIEEEECAAVGDNPKIASSEPAILPPELEWLTRLDAAPAAAEANETPPATQLPSLPAKSLKKSILKGSSSVLDLQDTHTSPLVVQAIAVTAEQLHKSTRANTLNNQRLSTAPVDLHKELLQPTTPTIAQLISVPLTSISFNPTQSLNSVSASAQSNFPNHLSSSVASVPSTTVQFTACPSISSSIGDGENHMCLQDGITASSSTSFPRIKLSETIDLDGFDENNSPVLLSQLHFNSSIATTSSYSAVSRPPCLVEGSNAAHPVIADGSRNIFSVNSTWATQASMTPSHSQALPSATASIVKSTLQRQSATRNLGVSIPSCKLIPDKTDSQFINNVPGSRSGIRFSDTFSITPSKFISEHQSNILPSLSDLRNPSILNPTANGYPKLFASSSYATLNATVDLSDTGKKITPVEQNPTVSSASVSYSGGVPGLALLNDCSNLLHSSSKGNENSQINSTFISNSCVEETSDGPSKNPYNEIRGATESNKTKLDLNGNYTTRFERPGSDGEDVSGGDACRGNRSSARQLLFNSPGAQPAGCQPSQNSTFCVEPSEGSVENLLPLNPLGLLEKSLASSVSILPSNPKPQLKLKSILKHSNSSSTARRYELGGAQNSRSAVGRSQSVRNLSASSSLLRRNFSSVGKPEPNSAQKGFAMRRVMSFKNRRYHQHQMENQENLAPRISTNKLLSSASCSNLTSFATATTTGSASKSLNCWRP